MNASVVVDTSCLIGLEKINRLDVLPQLFDSVIIPPSVSIEFGANLPFGTITLPKNIQLIASLRLLLGKGESEVIAIGVESEVPVILDDKQARQIALSMGVEIIGTVRVLLAAKKKGLLPSLTNEITALESQGFYISKFVKNEMIRLAGE